MRREDGIDNSGVATQKLFFYLTESTTEGLKNTQAQKIPYMNIRIKY